MTEPRGAAEELLGRRARREALAAESEPTALSTLRIRPAAAAVGILFAALYAWDLVEAIAALAALLDFAAAAGRPLNSYAWLVLGTGIVVPPVAFGTALVVGRGAGPLRLAAVLAVGLAASAALGLTVEALLRG